MKANFWLPEKSMLWFFIRNLNVQNAVFIWLLQLFVLISNRVLKLRQNIFSIIFVCFLTFFSFLLLILRCIHCDPTRPAVHLLLTTGLFYSQQKSNLVCQWPAPPHLPLPLCLLPSQLLLLLLFSSLSFCVLLSVAQKKLKQGVSCCCWYPAGFGTSIL